MNIGIILGSTREGRLSPQVGQWVLDIANEKKEANYKILDLKDYNLKFLGEEDDPNLAKWNSALNECDGFIFVTCEYNHSISGVLKNALDCARDAWNNKAAGIVSYGSVGGARAAEHLRGILGELAIADVRAHPTLSLYSDFADGVLKPQPFVKDNVVAMLNEVLTWSKALKTIRA